MKKSGAFFFAFLYLIASTGFSVQIHYCGDVVAEVAVISDLSDNSCSCDATDKLGSCCQEKSFEYKVNTKHLGQTDFINTSLPLLTILRINQPTAEVRLTQSSSFISPQYSRQQDPPKRILNCTFRI